MLVNQHALTGLNFLPMSNLCRENKNMATASAIYLAVPVFEIHA